MHFQYRVAFHRYGRDEYATHWSELELRARVVGKHFDEPTLIRAAEAFEKAAEWHNDSPHGPPVGGLLSQ